MPWWAQLLIALAGGGSVLAHVIQFVRARRERQDAVEDAERADNDRQESAVVVLLKEQIDDLCERVGRLEGRVEEERRAKHDAIQEVNRLTLENENLRRDVGRLEGRIEEMDRAMARIADRPNVTSKP